MQLVVKEDFFMRKKRVGKVAVFGTLKIMVCVSLLVAMSIVCGKYLAFGVGNVMRFSFENLSILISGMLFGPAVGAITGVAADIIGCFMVGYAINPAITLGAAVIGAVGGAVYRTLRRRTSAKYGVSVFAGVFCAHLLGSVLIKTVGLSAFYDMPFLLLLMWRALNYLAVGGVETFAIYYVLKNKSVISTFGKIERKDNELR